MGTIRKTKSTIQGSSLKGKNATKEIKGDAMKVSSIAKKRQAQSQRHASLRSQPRTSGVQTLPSRFIKQRLRINDRIEVFWDSHDSFFRGTVVGKKDKSFTIQYDDGTEFMHDLNAYRWRFVVLDGAGMETVSESLDLNFEPDDLQTSLKKFANVIEIERGRRNTGQPSKDAVESGMFLPLQVCKRLTNDYVKLMNGMNKLS